MDVEDTIYFNLAKNRTQKYNVGAFILNLFKTPSVVLKLELFKMISCFCLTEMEFVPKNLTESQLKKVFLLDLSNNTPSLYRFYC